MPNDHIAPSGLRPLLTQAAAVTGAGDANGTVNPPSDVRSVLRFQLELGSTGDVVAEGTMDGSTYRTLAVRRADTPDSPVDSADADGIWEADTTGCQAARLRSTANAGGLVATGVLLIG